jgi:hypothetical protein
MAKLREPPTPAELAKIEPEFRVLAAGRELWRVYFRGGRHPTLWSQFRAYGPTDARFDHHLPDTDGNAQAQERRIFYAAFSIRICLAEVFQQGRSVNRALRSPWIVSFRLERPVTLLDLSRLWPTRTGRASGAIHTGSRARSRRWSQTIYEAYPEARGLLYLSALDGFAPCVALYERAEDVLPQRPTFHRSFLDPAWETVLKNAARDLRYRITI